MSGSTASYISNFVTDARTNFLDQHLIEKAIDSIPESESYLGYSLPIGDIPASNDYIFYRPVAPLGGKLSWHVNIAPTALGRAVRDELKNILDNLTKRIKL